MGNPTATRYPSATPAWLSQARSGEREHHTGRQRECTADAPGEPGHRQSDGEVDSRHRQEAETGLERGEAEHALHELGGEEEADHRAEVERPGDVRRRASPVGEETQRHDRLSRALLVHDETGQQCRGHDGYQHDGVAPPTGG
jgi:hypothetical protein